jgi:hypothetical protein
MKFTLPSYLEDNSVVNEPYFESLIKISNSNGRSNDYKTEFGSKKQGTLDSDDNSDALNNNSDKKEIDDKDSGDDSDSDSDSDSGNDIADLFVKAGIKALANAGFDYLQYEVLGLDGNILVDAGVDILIGDLVGSDNNVLVNIGTDLLIGTIIKNIPEYFFQDGIDAVANLADNAASFLADNFDNVVSSVQDSVDDLTSSQDTDSSDSNTRNAPVTYGGRLVSTIPCGCSSNLLMYVYDYKSNSVLPLNYWPGRSKLISGSPTGFNQLGTYSPGGLCLQPGTPCWSMPVKGVAGGMIPGYGTSN